jgi:FKBP-type peptidyl-prolyl cis-trans isomerase SlyD
MRVVEIKTDAVVVDANHPLAGQTLHYSVSVREVRDATAEEIETAAAAFEEAESHVHDESCGHGAPQTEGGEELVTLGKKKKELEN